VTGCGAVVSAVTLSNRKGPKFPHERGCKREDAEI
jgi:hypothetical protein